MRAFLRCVAEAVVEVGLKGLADMVPGGSYVYSVAEKTLDKWRKRGKEKQDREEFLALANAKLDQVRAEAVQVVREVCAAVPAGVTPAPDEAIDLELYLESIPAAVRQSLKRAEDPAGTTVPATFALNSADDVVKLLPARGLRFHPGDAVAGKPGWILERLLGTGGFGEVWLGRHTRMSSLCGAIKFCFGQTGRDLIHEAALIDRVMAAGRHPNIVPLLDAHLEGDTPWLMFEYVPGGDLTDWIHTLAGQPPEKRLPKVTAAIRQLADGVAFFHGLPQPIVHRDLKPSNILLDRINKKLRITDFGIGSVTAREINRADGRGQSTRGGRLLSCLRGSHTPLYSSPEQRRGDDPDPRDDVHALGVIAYQMLTGRLDSGPGTGAKRVLERCGASSDLVELVLNCASEELEDRPASATAIRLPGAVTILKPPPELMVAPLPPAPAPEQTEWEIPVSGFWLSKLADAAEKVPFNGLGKSRPGGLLDRFERFLKLKEDEEDEEDEEEDVAGMGIRRTPARVKCEPGMVYELGVYPNQDSDLQGLAHLAKLPQLTDVGVLPGSQVTDTGFKHLTKLTQLKSLAWLGADRLTDAGFAHLTKLTQLEVLSLSLCRNLTDAGMAHLAKLIRLKSLFLHHCDLTDAGLKHLAKLPQLQALEWIGHSELTDIIMAHLAKLTRLTRLKLVGGVREEGPTDAGISHLSQLTQLTELELFPCMRLTDASVAHLAKLTRLKRLILSGCYQFAISGYQMLRQVLPKCHVTVSR